MSACSTIETIDGQKTASQSKENVVRYRDNINSLLPEKLDAYEHAVAMMKKKIERNVFDRTGFLWQAWVHNCTNIDANSCTHIKGNDGLTKNIGTPNFC